MGYMRGLLYQKEEWHPKDTLPGPKGPERRKGAVSWESPHRDPATQPSPWAAPYLSALFG